MPTTREGVRLGTYEGSQKQQRRTDVPSLKETQSAHGLLACPSHPTVRTPGSPPGKALDTGLGGVGEARRGWQGAGRELGAAQAGQSQASREQACGPGRPSGERVLGGEDLPPRAPAEQSRAGWPQARAHLKVCGLLFRARAQAGDGGTQGAGGATATLGSLEGQGSEKCGLPAERSGWTERGKELQTPPFMSNMRPRGWHGSHGRWGPAGHRPPGGPGLGPQGLLRRGALRGTRPGPHPPDTETPSEMHSGEGSGAAASLEREREGREGREGGGGGQCAGKRRPPEAPPEPHSHLETAEAVSCGQLRWSRACRAQVTGDPRPAAR